MLAYGQTTRHPMMRERRPRRQVRGESAPNPPTPAPASTAPISRLTFVAAIAGVAFLARLIHLWQIQDAPFFSVLFGDAHAYDAWARRIAGGDWIGSQVFYQAPLYPYFIGVVYAVVGRDLFTLRLVQAAIGSASCVLLGLAAWRLYSQRAGLIAGLGLALYAPAIFFDGLIQKTILDVALLCLSLWWLSGLVHEPRDARRWAALGVAMGALTLTRENAIALVAVVVIWAILASSLRTALIFAVAVAAVLAPVAIRNYAVGGGFYLTTSQFGPNFYIGNNPSSDGTYASLRFGRGAPEYERQDATELAQRATGRSLSPAEVSGYWTGRAVAFITTQPGAWLRLMVRKFQLLWNASEMLDTESQETYAEHSFLLRATGWFTHFGLLVPLAIFGVIVGWPACRRAWVFLAMAAVYAAGLATPLEWIRSTPPTRRAVAGAALAVALVFTNWPLLSSARMRAITETNLAAALQGEGRLDEAVTHYRRALEWQSEHAPALNNLGTALRAQGKLDEAVATYERALSANASYPDAHYNLANALLERREPERAAQHFEIALHTIPDSVETRNNMGIALMDQRKYDEAIASFRAALQIDPTSTKTLRNLATALDARGHIDEAVETLQHAIAIDPKDESALYDLGSTMLEVAQHEAAIDAFRKALAVNPRSVEAHNNVGIALASLGRLDEAIAAFEQALAIRPDFADALKNLATARAAAKSAPPVL